MFSAPPPCLAFVRTHLAGLPHPRAEQVQQAAAVAQLTTSAHGAQFWAQLDAFAKIRQEHDRIYMHEAFPTQTDRETIESLHVPNTLIKPGGAGDPAMRQRARDGSYVKMSRRPEPRSKVLKRACTFFTDDVLRHLDGRISTMQHGLEPCAKAAADGKVSRQAMERLAEELPHPELVQLKEAYGDDLLGRCAAAPDLAAALDTSEMREALGLAAQLGLLVIDRQRKLRGAGARDHRNSKDGPTANSTPIPKRGAGSSAGGDRSGDRSASGGPSIAEQIVAHLRQHAVQTSALTLWPSIVARTDELLLAAESMHPIFQKVGVPPPPHPLLRLPASLLTCPPDQPRCLLPMSLRSAHRPMPC